MEELLKIMENQPKDEDRQNPIDTSQRQQMINLMSRFMNLDQSQ